MCIQSILLWALYSTLGSAHAHEPSFPNVSIGSTPFAYYQGTIQSGQETDVFTQSTQHDFLVTTAFQSSRNCDVYQDSTQIVNGKSGVMDTSGHGTLFLGKGLLRIDAGSTLKVKAVGDNCTFHISGYHIEIGSPYVHLTGSVSTNSSQTVHTIPSGKTFILQSIIMGGTQPETCDVYISGNLVLEGHLRAMTREDIHSAATNGNLRIPVAENETIDIHNTGVSSPCHYYLEGTYVQ